MISNHALVLGLWSDEVDSCDDVKVRVEKLANFLPCTDLSGSMSEAIGNANEKYPDSDILLLNISKTYTLEYLQRIINISQQYPDIELISPLPLQSAGLSTEAIARIDANQFMNTGHCLFLSKHAPSHGSMIRAGAAKKYRGNPLIELYAAQIDCMSTGLIFSSDPVNGVEHYGDGKPVILHVLHSWGGGIEVFANDLQAGDINCHHLFLKSHSLNNASPFGKRLALYQRLDQPPLQQWDLKNPVSDTEVHSPEIASIINTLIPAWGIGAILVSSLIGQSLDIFNTGLPTCIVAHDIYPFWPVLHDVGQESYDKASLQKSLENTANDLIFNNRDAAHWWHLKDAVVKLMISRQVSCVAPSEFAKQRLLKIQPELAQLNWHCIAHGSAPIIRLPENFSERLTAKKLKVLIPGRINGGKGEHVLRELIALLPEDVELILLGSAHLSEEFSGMNIRVFPDYKREDLHIMLNILKPHLALLPSVVPETYGYVLSEMLQSGIPVLCSNIGAYAERARSCDGIETVAANAKNFLERILYYRDNREALIKMASHLPVELSTLQHMAEAWCGVIKPHSPSWQWPLNENRSTCMEVLVNLQLNEMIEAHKQLLNAYTEQKNQHEAAIQKMQQDLNSNLAAINAQLAEIAGKVEQLKDSKVDTQQLAEIKTTKLFGFIKLFK
jgi:glycosyltransferase involved in cell wall biosynthesis